jgi:hypothetical protein
MCRSAVIILGHCQLLRLLLFYLWRLLLLPPTGAGGAVTATQAPKPWPVSGCSSTRNYSFGGGVAPAAPPPNTASWLYSVPSKATASGTYASFALDGSAVYALVHTEVHKIDASTGEAQWLISPFNPRGARQMVSHSFSIGFIRINPETD